MSDYIRKAAELAKGWSYQLDYDDGKWIFRVLFAVIMDDCGEEKPMILQAYDDLPQWVLDALAAQLVRQVDKAGYAIYCGPDGSSIWKDGETPDDNDTPFFDLTEDYSCDRAMNTIKAIVDSKVLE